MKNYKEFEKEYIGSSDVASLIMSGYVEGKGLDLNELHFVKDGSYYAYIVNEAEATIGNHYHKVAEYKNWLKIYDDLELVRKFRAEKIVIYRAAEMGCIIQLID